MLKFAGAVYHVMARGNERRAIFRDDKDRERLRQRVEQLAAAEPDERIKMWLLARLGGERSAVLGRRFGYRDGSGVAYALRRVEAEAGENAALREKLEQAKREISSLQSWSSEQRTTRLV